VNELIMISGKPRDQCILALRAAFGNPDRAFEYLLSGVNLAAVANQPGAGAEAAGYDDGDDYGDEEGSADPMAMGGNPFAALASNPNFNVIRQRILQDPSFYQQFMS
jgi:UV excision repair protein RAD23